MRKEQTPPHPNYRNNKLIHQEQRQSKGNIVVSITSPIVIRKYFDMRLQVLTHAVTSSYCSR